jgi:MFS family permease
LLDGDATTLAILTAGAGAGSILGGLIVSRQGGRTRQLYRLVLSGLSLAALVLLSMSLWGALPVVAVAVGCVSLATTVVGTGNQALTQLMIDESYRGRVMSLWTVVAMGTPAVGAVLLGTLADRVGFVAAMALPAVAVLVLVMISRQVLIRQAGS